MRAQCKYVRRKPTKDRYTEDDTQPRVPARTRPDPPGPARTHAAACAAWASRAFLASAFLVLIASRRVRMSSACCAGVQRL